VAQVNPPNVTAIPYLLPSRLPEKPVPPRAQAVGRCSRQLGRRRWSTTCSPIRPSGP